MNSKIIPHNSKGGVDLIPIAVHPLGYTNMEYKAENQEIFLTSFISCFRSFWPFSQKLHNGFRSKLNLIINNWFFKNVFNLKFLKIISKE